MLKVLFAGTPDVAVPALRVLAANRDHFDVVAVLTRPDAPSGRGRRLTPSPVKRAAVELGLPVIESDPGTPEFLGELASTGAEAAAVVAYGKILRQPVLDALPRGWYNLHFSLLPQWRGAAPVQRAIWAGDDITGASVFRITKGMDEGPILAQSTLEIGAHETAGELLSRLADDGSRLLAASMQTVADGRAHLIEQPHGAYEVAAKIRAEDAHIRFDVPVFAVDRQIRACTPHPGAWCVLHPNGVDPSEADTGREPGSTLHVLRARPAQSGAGEPPEHVQPGALLVGKRQVWIGTATGPLELLEVKAEGKKAMQGADWARGARLADTAYCD